MLVLAVRSDCEVKLSVAGGQAFVRASLAFLLQGFDIPSAFSGAQHCSLNDIKWFPINQILAPVSESRSMR